MEIEKMEKDVCNLPMIFTEMFKDEINANDEQRLYNGIKRIVKKYSEDSTATSVMNEFTRILSGGASLDEILQIAIDEAIQPTVVSDLTIDNTCKH